MRTPMPRYSCGHGQVVDLEVQARLDREDHAGLEDAVVVHLAARLRAVVHVDAEVVARAVDHVAAVVSAVVGVERLFGGHREQPPLGDARRDDLHRGLVDLAELHTGLGGGEAGVGGLAHRLVDAPLHLGEAAAHRAACG